MKPSVFSWYSISLKKCEAGVVKQVPVWSDVSHGEKVIHRIFLQKKNFWEKHKLWRICCLYSKNIASFKIFDFKTYILVLKVFSINRRDLETDETKNTENRNFQNFELGNGKSDVNWTVIKT